MKKILMATAMMVLLFANNAYPDSGATAQHAGQGLSILVEGGAGALLLFSSAWALNNLEQFVDNKVIAEALVVGDAFLGMGVSLMLDAAYKTYTWYWRACQKCSENDKKQSSTPQT